MKSAAVGFLVTILFVGSAFSQVHIRESATITPGQIKGTQAIVNHTLRFVFSWDKGGGRIYVPSSPCGALTQDVYYGNGNPDSIWIEVSPAPAGTYVLDPQFCVACLNPGEVAKGTFSIYLDGALVVQSSHTFSNSQTDVYVPWPDGVFGFTTPYYSDFDFSLLLTEGSFYPYVPHVKGIDNCNPTPWSPHTDPLTLTIVSGSQYGSFHQNVNGTDTKIGASVTTVGDSIGDFSVVFDGVLPDSITGWIVVEASSAGITKRDSVQVIGRPIVTITPSEIFEGDLATVNVQWLNASGGIINNYEAGVVSGDQYGDLLTDTTIYGHEGTYLQQIKPPFLFYAFDGLDSDSVMVEIRVGVEQLMLGSAHPGGKGNDEQAKAKGGVTNMNSVSSVGKMSAGKASSQGVSTPAPKLTSSVVDDFVYPYWNVAWVKVKRRQNLVILQPTANLNDEHITHEPKMPTVTCEAQLQGYNGGQVTYDWEYSTADTFLQKTAPTKDSPSRPLPPRYSGTGFLGNTSETGSNVSQWQVPFNGLFTGGKTLLIVNAMTNEGKTYSDTVYANSIIGDNPTATEVKSGLTIPQQVIVYMESLPKWCQFNVNEIDKYNRKGYPVYGPPRGFGLMQLDNSPSPSEQDLWNWKTNLNDGIGKFNSMLKSAGGYAGRVDKGKTWYKLKNGSWEPNDPVSFAWYGVISDAKNGGKHQIAYKNAEALTSDQMIREAFQRYNGGAYWKWYPDKHNDPGSTGRWKPDPPKGSGSDPTPYGDKAWKYYQDVESNQPPAGWNP